MQFPVALTLLLSLTIVGLSRAEPLPESSSQPEIVLALMPSSVAQRELFYDIVQGFEAEFPKVRVRIRAYDPPMYKADISEWLASEVAHADVYQWFAGERLKQFVAAGRVAPLDSTILEEGFSTALTDLVSVKKIPYALPMNFYQWGLYSYRPAVAKTGLTLPDELEALPDYCREVAKTGKSAFVVGGSSPWALAGWFDYLNLRLNGLDYHQDLLSGQASFQSERARQVFTLWREMHDAGCFLEPIDGMDWKDALPFFYRGRALHVLMGNFFLSQVPEKLHDQIDFKPFPRSGRRADLYEDMPVDVFFLAGNAVAKEPAKQLLSYLARPDVQGKLAAGLFKIPARSEAPLSPNRFIQEGARLQERTQGLAQFFDRDSTDTFSRQAMPLLVDWLVGRLPLDEILKRLDSLPRR